MPDILEKAIPEVSNTVVKTVSKIKFVHGKGTASLLTELRDKYRVLSFQFTNLERKYSEVRPFRDL